MRLLLMGIFSVFTSLSLTVLSGCGGDEKAALSTLHTAIYTGAGSVWMWDLKEDGNFTATKKATKDAAQAQLSISGTYTALSTGYLKFTVASASSPDGSIPNGDLPAAGVEAFGFAIPGVIMIVKPIGEDTDILAMPVFSTTCPEGNVSFNWVQASTSSEGGDLTTKDFWGNALLTPTAGPLTGAKWILDGTEQPNQTLTTHTGCTDGVYSFTDGFISMTSSGVGLVNTDNNDGDIVAIPRETGVVKTSLDGKSFVGLAFSEGDRANTIQPITTSFTSNGVGSYAFYSNVETGSTEGAETGTLTVTEAGTGEKAGFLKLEAGTGNSDTPTMWGAVSTDVGGSGRTFVFASGVSVPNVGTPDNSFSVLFVER